MPAGYPEGEGICTGPRAAFIDLNGDGTCDRLPAPATLVAQADDAPPVIEHARPLGLVDDPYPGACNLYVDADGDGTCDLSQNHLQSAAAQPIAEQNAEAPAPTGEASVLTACPLGLVNDPYPGECKWYVDTNGNSICDLSESELAASGAVVAPRDNVTTSFGGTQQQRRRHGRNK